MVTKKNVLGAGDGEDGFYRLGLYMYLSIQSLASIIDLINSCEIKRKKSTQSKEFYSKVKSDRRYWRTKNERIKAVEKNRDQVVKMLQEQIGRLQKRVGYLEKLLDEADISYDKDCNESGEDIDNAVNNQNLKESQKIRVPESYRRQSPKTTPFFFILCSREGQMFTVKEQQNPIPKRVRRDIIHSAGISGRTAYVRRKEEYRSSVRTVPISGISSLQVTT